MNCFSKPFAFSYRFANLRGPIATKVNLNQIQKYFGMGFLGPKTNYWDPKLLLIPEKNHVQATLIYTVL
jgi:hypothetical protein